MSDPKQREPDLESPFLNEDIVGHIPGAPVAELCGDDEVDVNHEDEDFSEEEEDAETLASEDEQEDDCDEKIPPTWEQKHIRRALLRWIPAIFQIPLSKKRSLDNVRWLRLKVQNDFDDD